VCVCVCVCVCVSECARPRIYYTAWIRRAMSNATKSVVNQC